MDAENLFALNSLLSRTSFFGKILDGRYQTRDVDQEGGYPPVINIRDLANMYRRNDIASRVVDLLPDESWKEYPQIWETEEERETPFEIAVDRLANETRLFSYLHRIDRVSGIGRFGVLFIGLDDGKDFTEPAPGFTLDGPADSPGQAKVLYYRVFDESAVQIAGYEEDHGNPRYGLPKYYNLMFYEPTLAESTGSMPSVSPATETIKVHWSRCLHIADNLLTSEIFGMPRMENVYNRLLDLRKINAGAGEMFWKGGFPGYSFEVDPRNGELDDEQREAIKDEIQKWEEGLTRYFAGVGVSMKSLSPQIANPEPFVSNVLRIIAATKGIPMRLFIGTESASVASTQDANTWLERVALRREMYVTPGIIRPCVDRMIQYGALPPTEIKDGEAKIYAVKWTPLAEMTQAEKAEVGLKRTEALARYATAGAEALVPLDAWLSKIMLMPYQEVQAMMETEPTNRSLVVQQAEMAMLGMTGQQDNLPSSVPNMPGIPKPDQTQDPSKTPENVVQPKKTKDQAEPKKISPTNPGTAQE